MRKFYVAYRITTSKDNKITYGVASYTNDFVLPLNNKECEKMLLKSINKKSTHTKEHQIEWLYQNIEEQECKRYIEIVFGVQL